MNKRKVTFTSDPGHGWLSVSLKDLKELDIVDKISSYSYMTTSRAYLEEDLDAGVFLKAAKQNNWEINLREVNVETTPIRSYAHYSPERLKFALDLKKGSEFKMYSRSEAQWSTDAKVTGLEANKVLFLSEHGSNYAISKTSFLKYIRLIAKEEILAKYLEEKLPISDNNPSKMKL